ncbi:MAG: chromosomal replication initiator protein DnaA [Muribaculaceae bacterium]|nr:chromosomal replication initiator protein DnaA [Muribaculaceae bacterium]
MTEDYKIKWNRCLDIIRDNIGDTKTVTWFLPAKPLSFQDNTLTLGIPSNFFYEKYEDEFYSILSSTLKKVFGPAVRLDYEISIIRNDNDSKVKFHASKQSHAVKNKFIQSMQAPSPLGDSLSDKKPDFDPQLNESLNFENYCIGESNRLPFTIAEYIANHPGKNDFNPFFLYGDVGVGKTHLIQAIGIRVKERNPNAKVLFVTLRQFQNLMANATIRKQIPSFLNWFQQMDVLLIDDLQELSHKDGTAKVLFPIFNHLHQNVKALVFTCDRPPMELDGIADRLIDRFKWGITERLPKPDLALKKKILSFKAAKNGLSLPPEVIDIIAEQSTGSVRELEGIVMGILTRSITLNAPIDLTLAQEVMRNSIKKVERKAINFDMIVEATAEFYRLNPDVIFSKSRVRDIADARQVIMYLCHKLTSLSSSAIGQKLNRRHATVLHGISAIADRLPYTKELSLAVEKIEEGLKA